MELVGADNYDQVRRDHQGWSAKLLGNGNDRDDKWTTSIDVGNKDFVDKVKAKLGALAKGRDARKTEAGFQLREPANSYMHHFEVKNDKIGPENT